MGQIIEIQTSRFGCLQVEREDIIQFPEGLLGFAHLRQFILLDDPHDDIFAWLQSCEEAHIAFPVLEPELFSSTYQVSLSKGDLENLRLSSMEGSRFFSIITIPEDPTTMTANLKAPLVINVGQRIARQCVLQDNQLAIREPIFQKLQQRVFQNPVASFKAPIEELTVSVPRPEPTVEG